MVAYPRRLITHKCLKLAWSEHKAENVKLHKRVKREKLREAKMEMQELYWNKCKAREDTL